MDLTQQTIPAVFLMGPTASGKTGLSLALYQAIQEGKLAYKGAEIISVDSAQVFRGMNIGTAKPEPEILSKIKHHLVDILDPLESYSAAQFVEDALILINTTRAAGKLPILVGGTGLYFRALEQGLSNMPTADLALREKLAAEAEQIGWPAMHQRLAILDPKSAEKIKPNDQQRINRALEVIMLSGISLSDHWQAPKSATNIGPILKFALKPVSREQHHVVMAERFMQMMKDGFLNEVQALHARGDLHLGLPAVRAVGYRQLWDFLESNCTLDEAVQRGIIATRQYAKRQLTWLRGEQNVCWISPQTEDSLNRITEQLINTQKMT